MIKNDKFNFKDGLNSFGISPNLREMRSFFDSINYKTLDDLDDKPSLEKIKKLSPMLNDYNPLTYTIYLQLRPDLDDGTKAYYSQVINKLVDKEKKLVDEALKYLEDNSKKINNLHFDN